MSGMSRAIARRNRFRAVDLTPWARQALPGWEEIRLPAGYRISGLAKTPRGPYLVHLFRPDQTAETHRDVPLATYPALVRRLADETWIHSGLRERCTVCRRVVDSREVVAISLPRGELGALCIACQDRREEAYTTVTLDREGYILDIEDEEGEGE